MVSNSEIATKSLIFAIGSYFGWLIFNGINDLIPSISEIQPVMKIIIGLLGLWVLVRLGLRKMS